jgi:hypothetical protein
MEKHRDERDLELYFKIFVDAIVLSSLSLIENGNSKFDPLSAFFLYKIKRGEKVEMLYYPRVWQRAELDRLAKRHRLGLKKDPMEILKHTPFPADTFQSGSVVSTGLTEMWKAIFNQEPSPDYPKDLLRIEEKIWNPDEFEILYVPSNELFGNRFLLAFRLKKDHKLNDLDIDIISKLVANYAKVLKSSFFFSLLHRELSSSERLPFMVWSEDEANITDMNFTMPGCRTRSLGWAFLKAALVYKDEILKNSRKAAVAVVMSRNMSHNIGSHILARLSDRQDLDPIDKGQLAILNSYLRTRMDFLADISTGASASTMPLRIYLDVIANYKPHVRDTDVFKGQKVILDRISGIDKLKSGSIELPVISDSTAITRSNSGDADCMLFSKISFATGRNTLWNYLQNSGSVSKSKTIKKPILGATF